MSLLLGHVIGTVTSMATFHVTLTLTTFTVWINFFHVTGRHGAVAVVLGSHLFSRVRSSLFLCLDALVWTYPHAELQLQIGRVHGHEWALGA